MIVDFSTFTWIHVVISLAPLAAGPVVVAALLKGGEAGGWTPFFRVTAVASSATGFGFPFDRFLPSHAVGIVALLVLLVTIPARYIFGLVGVRRWIYPAGLVISLYLDAFVLVVQLFAKVPALTALAPTGDELPFVVDQLTLLAIVAVVGVLATRRFGTTLAEA